MSDDPVKFIAELADGMVENAVPLLAGLAVLFMASLAI